MASGFYTKALQHFAQGDIKWKPSGGDTFKVALIDTADYTVDLAAHEYLSSVASGARVATATLTVLTPTSGILDANDVTFPTPSGDSCEAILVYQDTGSAATSLLILYIADASAGLPVTPDGATNILINWSGLTNKIAAL